jgi:sugar lactone lactonase YvrE
MATEKLCRSSEAAMLELPADAIAFAFHGDEAFAAGGSKIVRIRFELGRPIGDCAAEDMPTGDNPKEGLANQRRRPCRLAAEELASGAKEIAGLASAPDGVLYVSDAAGGVVYRVTRGASPPNTMISSSSEPVATPVLARAFRVAGLSGPDAVVHDEEQDVYFVSNVDGAIGAKDGKGFISRVTPDGKVAQRKFIDGLDAPKGLALRGTELWVADIDVVRVFDRVTGAESKKIDLAPHGAVFLQDVAVGPDEAIYVTDTDIRFRGEKERLRQGHGRIFRVAENGAVEVAFQGEELRSPSGIVWDGTRFLIAQAYGNEVLAWNRGTGTKAVLRGPGAFDGIVVLPNGAVIVSSHYDESLHVGRSGAMRPLFTRKPSPGDIAFDRKRNLLLIPSIDGDWLEAWTLPPLDVPATTAREGVKEMARQ